MSKEHHYQLNLAWTGNKGSGTSDYRAYDRSYSVLIDHKQALHCSSDPAFHGDATKHNPEDLLLASISSCHMLWYLHLCADAGVVVVDYADHATGTMIETATGGGRFREVTLHPLVTVTEKQMIGKANALHQKANELCFIANSLNFEVKHEPVCKTQS
jgi:organic hydroperoxide reductase OsmC/OhrA